MTFVTVGTEQFPFERLIRSIDLHAGNGLLGLTVCQIGTSNYIPANCLWKRFVDFRGMIYYLRNADLVIAHAGVGTFLLCRNLGHIPILVPRCRDFGEHVDNHQVFFAQCIDSIGYAVVANDLDELDSLLRRQNYLQRQLQNGDRRHNSAPMNLEKELDEEIRYNF